MIRLVAGIALGPAQTRPRNCVQTSIALALDLPVEAMEREAGSTATLRLPDVRWLVDRLGVASPLMAADLVAAYWPLYYRRYGARRLRGYGIRTPRNGEPLGHAFVLLGPRLYDPLTGAAARLSPNLLRQELDWVGFVDPSPDASRRLAQLRDRHRRVAARDVTGGAPGSGVRAARGVSGGITTAFPTSGSPDDRLTAPYTVDPGPEASDVTNPTRRRSQESE